MTTKVQYKAALGHLKTAEKRIRQAELESALTWVTQASGIILAMPTGSPKRQELEERLRSILYKLRGMTK